MTYPERLSTARVFDGKVFDVDRDRLRMPNGREVTIDVVRHVRSVVLVPVPEPGHVILIRQYRHPVNRFLWELPAGSVDPGEEPDQAASRELEEETGYRPGRLEPLGWVWTTPGFSNEIIHLYLALDLVPANQALQDDEVLTVERLALEEAVARALDGRLHDSKSVCCVLRAARRLRDGALW